MTDAAWNHLFSMIEVVALAWIGYLTAKNRAMNVTNSDKLDSVVSQTNGMSSHLIGLQKVVSHAAGVADEKADQAIREARATPIESRVGPDRLNAGPTDKPA